LIVACVAQAARDIDEGVPARSLPRREIEENFWRAIRHGLEGRMIDLDSRQEYPAGEVLDRLLAWSAPARAELGIEVALPELNGAQRQRRMLETGATLPEVYAASVEETRETYAGALGSPAEVRR
jgi:carboxylate-amine ligase